MRKREQKIKDLTYIVRDELFQASQDTIHNDWKKSRIFYMAYTALETIIHTIDWDNIQWDNYEPTAEEVTKSASEMMPEF